MGSMIELNDTLQITKEQGFPEEMIQAHNLIDRNEQTRYGF